jgi:hypothetical protein
MNFNPKMFGIQSNKENHPTNTPPPISEMLIPYPPMIFPKNLNRPNEI